MSATTPYDHRRQAQLRPRLNADLGKEPPEDHSFEAPVNEIRAPRPPQRRLRARSSRCRHGQPFLVSTADPRISSCPKLPVSTLHTLLTRSDEFKCARSRDPSSTEASSAARTPGREQSMMNRTMPPLKISSPGQPQRSGTYWTPSSIRSMVYDPD
jgi:hypothetical protein